MKRIILGVLLIHVVLGLAAQKKVTINATLSGDAKGFNKIFVYSATMPSDSVTMQNGKFTVTVPYEKPFMLLMYTEYEVRSNGMYQPFGLLVDRPGTITLKGDITKGLSHSKVTGMESAVVYRQFNDGQGEAFKQVTDALKEKFGKTWLNENDPGYADFEVQRTTLQKKYIGAFLEKFVSEHPDSYATVTGLSGFGRNFLTPDELEKTVARLSKRIQNTQAAKDLLDFAAGVRNSAIGSYVSDFTLNTPDEKPVNFKNDFKGKYVLIDFWASWCGPCKQSFPHMKEVYHQYKSDKFEIYSISIDQSKDAWLKGVKEQDLPWVQTLDTKNVSKKGFAITGVPTTYLISPEGQILAKDIGFDPEGNGSTEKMIRKIFGDKSEGQSTPAATITPKEETTRPAVMKAMKMQ